MGETPNDIQRQMNGTRADIEATLGALKASSSSAASDARTQIALTVDDLGTRTSDAATKIAQAVPKLENPVPLVIALAVVGFAMGFVTPLSTFERKRLRPLGDEVVRRAQSARSELASQGRAAVKAATDKIGA